MKAEFFFQVATRTQQPSGELSSATKEEQTGLLCWRIFLKVQGGGDVDVRPEQNYELPGEGCLMVCSGEGSTIDGHTT